MSRLIPEEMRIKQINAIPNIAFVSWVDGYKGNTSKANVRCSSDGFEWIATPSGLINQNLGCPQCSGKRRWTAKERIEQINKLEGIEFVSWHGCYKNKNSKANVRCLVDGTEWSSCVNNLVNGLQGCPKCSRISGGISRRVCEDDVISKINNRNGIAFVGWVSCYTGNMSYAIVKCKVDGYIWSAKVSKLTHKGTGCPMCARTGFNKGKTGYLYALRSECGQHVKVGISNDPKRRHKELQKRTPFKFNLIEKVSGDGVKISELEKHFHTKYERAGFTEFDGATEWLICCDELLGELRSINA